MTSTHELQAGPQQPRLELQGACQAGDLAYVREMLKTQQLELQPNPDSVTAVTMLSGTNEHSERQLATAIIDPSDTGTSYYLGISTSKGIRTFSVREFLNLQPGERATIGRDEDETYQVKDEQVTRHGHITISRGEDGRLRFDCASTNPTLLLEVDNDPSQFGITVPRNVLGKASSEEAAATTPEDVESERTDEGAEVREDDNGAIDIQAETLQRTLIEVQASLQGARENDLRVVPQLEDMSQKLGRLQVNLDNAAIQGSWAGNGIGMYGELQQGIRSSVEEAQRVLQGLMQQENSREPAILSVAGRLEESASNSDERDEDSQADRDLNKVRVQVRELAEAMQGLGRDVLVDDLSSLRTKLDTLYQSALGNNMTVGDVADLLRQVVANIGDVSGRYLNRATVSGTSQEMAARLSGLTQ